jgi:serine/threonine protein kinase
MVDSITEDKNKFTWGNIKRDQLLKSENYMVITGYLINRTLHRLRNNKVKPRTVKIPKIEVLHDISLSGYVNLTASVLYGKYRRLPRSIEQIRKSDQDPTSMIMSFTGLNAITEEVKLIVSAISHPFLLKFHTWWESEIYHYFLYEAAPCGTIETYINNYGTSIVLCRIFMFQILCAMEYLHNCRIVHNFIRPQSIFLNRHGYAKLGFYSKAKYYDENGKGKIKIRFIVQSRDLWLKKLS